MTTPEAIAIVGPCPPERRSYGRRLAAATGRAFIPAGRRGRGEDAVDAALAAVAGMSHGAVIELPSLTHPPALIGAAADDPERVRLVGIVCVLDAVHLLDDLGRDDFVVIRGAHSRGESIARSLIVATQIEYASMIVLVNWEPLSTAELSMTMSLVSHLSPQARLRLDRPNAEAWLDAESFSATQERPGWVAVLNDAFDPHMTDPRVGALRYEQPRAFHPSRLRDLIERIGAREFGTVIRSAGFCRFATRPGITAGWEQAGQTISFAPLIVDDRLDPLDEPLAFGQDLAFIGLDLRSGDLAVALDQAALSDAELAAGPVAWDRFDDPFPAWHVVTDPAD